MFSDNIKDYILNNINERDFFDNKFLNLSQERSKLFTYDKAVKSYLEILE